MGGAEVVMNGILPGHCASQDIAALELDELSNWIDYTLNYRRRLGVSGTVTFHRSAGTSQIRTYAPDTQYIRVCSPYRVINMMNLQMLSHRPSSPFHLHLRLCLVHFSSLSLYYRLPFLPLSPPSSSPYVVLEPRRHRQHPSSPSSSSLTSPRPPRLDLCHTPPLGSRVLPTSTFSSQPSSTGQHVASSFSQQVVIARIGASGLGPVHHQSAP